MARQIQQTSIDSYHSIPNLGEKQQSVLIAINGNPDKTDRELTKIMGFQDPNNVRPRRKDLVDLGLVVCSGERKCSVTGKTVMTWRVKA